MKRTIWLASYPKSGNTWLRIMAASYLAPADRILGINDPLNLGSMASARSDFDNATLIDSSLLTHDEAENLRPRVHEAFAQGLEREDEEDAESGVRFEKTHDAYTNTTSGEALLAGARGAERAIVLVRDPRDITGSLAHHLGIGVDRAIALLGDEKAELSAYTDRLRPQLRQRLGTWSQHVASWLGQADIPICLIRYEDLAGDTEAALTRAMSFAGLAIDPVGIRRAVAAAAFDRLRQQEQETGFGEAPRGRMFFRSGRVGAWRQELTRAQVDRIEGKHADMMRRLNYTLSAGGCIAE